MSDVDFISAEQAYEWALSCYKERLDKVVAEGLVVAAAEIKKAIQLGHFDAFFKTESNSKGRIENALRLKGYTVESTWDSSSGCQSFRVIWSKK